MCERVSTPGWGTAHCGHHFGVVGVTAFSLRSPTAAPTRINGAAALRLPHLAKKLMPTAAAWRPLPLH